MSQICQKLIKNFVVWTPLDALSCNLHKLKLLYGYDKQPVRDVYNLNKLYKKHPLNKEIFDDLLCVIFGSNKIMTSHDMGLRHDFYTAAILVCHLAFLDFFKPPKKPGKMNLKQSYLN